MLPRGPGSVNATYIVCMYICTYLRYPIGRSWGPWSGMELEPAGACTRCGQWGILIRSRWTLDVSYSFRIRGGDEQVKYGITSGQVYCRGTLPDAGPSCRWKHQHPGKKMNEGRSLERDEKESTRTPICEIDSEMLPSLSGGCKSNLQNPFSPALLRSHSPHAEMHRVFVNI